MDFLTKLISLALFEDSGLGDLTSESILSRKHCGKGVIIAKESMVIAGIDVAHKVFKMLDHDFKISSSFKDGDLVKQGDIVFQIKGNLINMLKGERVALNFMQRLSGIATYTRSFVNVLKDFNVRICDTRKTIPGFRSLEKAAVRAGGAFNHRISLSDSILIKDNHIAVAKGIENAVQAVKLRISHLTKIEVEVSNIQEVKQAVKAGVDVIMLDNMNISQMKKAVDYIKKRAVVEASGNVSLQNIKEIAKTGVDVISCGAITHQARAVDLSMKINLDEQVIA